MPSPLNKTKGKARHSINRHTWASVERLGSQRRENLSRRAFNSRKNGSSAITHTMPLCKMSTPTLGRLVSNFLGKIQPVRLSSHSGAHGTPVQGRMLSAALNAPSGESSISRLATEFGHAISVRRNPRRLASAQNKHRYKSKSKSKSK
jgi:hypothetical protein